MESTYGGKDDYQPSRKEATERLSDIIKRTLSKKGRVLIPVFAVGRSQEVMIVLENLMKSGEVDKVPIYLDGMIWEATAIHTAYPEYLNTHLRSLIFQKGENPLLSDIFERVESFDKRQEILDNNDPCIVLALKSWSEDERNTLIFVGYQAEGTLGRKIQKGWKEIPMSIGGAMTTIKVNMNIETCDGFSGHSDRRQLINYVNNMSPRPEKIVFCHGEESKCLEISSTIHKKFNINTLAPMNLETIRFR